MKAEMPKLLVPEKHMEVMPSWCAELTVATLGTQLAQEYGDNDDILFGLMNEPHDLDMNLWGATMQAVVDAIRGEIGNNNKILLLPGTNFTYVRAPIPRSAPDAYVAGY